MGKKEFLARKTVSEATKDLLQTMAHYAIDKNSMYPEEAKALAVYLHERHQWVPIQELSIFLGGYRAKRKGERISKIPVTYETAIEYYKGLRHCHGWSHTIRWWREDVIKTVLGLKWSVQDPSEIHKAYRQATKEQRVKIGKEFRKKVFERFRDEKRHSIAFLRNWDIYHKDSSAYLGALVEVTKRKPGWKKYIKTYPKYFDKWTQ